MAVSSGEEGGGFEVGFFAGSSGGTAEAEPGEHFWGGLVMVSSGKLAVSSRIILRRRIEKN